MNQEESKDATEPLRDGAPRPAAKGVILRSGRIRLPDKLIQYLNNEVAVESLFWQPDGQGFSIDCDKVQKDLLDKHFHGTKLSSFLRSLNRWGFKRLFVSFCTRYALILEQASTSISPDSCRHSTIPCPIACYPSIIPCSVRIRRVSPRK
jgi:HSF-type DNA-binding